MEDRRSGSTAWLTGLSARLLILTIFFVMLSEVFIYAPSIGRYRLVYMQERIAAAHLASLALDAPSDNVVGVQLMEQLLDHARSHGLHAFLAAKKACNPCAAKACNPCAAKRACNPCMRQIN